MSVELLISQISEEIDSVELVHQILGEKLLAKLEGKKQEVMNEISDKLARNVEKGRNTNTHAAIKSNDTTKIRDAFAKNGKAVKVLNARWARTPKKDDTTVSDYTDASMRKGEMGR